MTRKGRGAIGAKVSATVDARAGAALSAPYLLAMDRVSALVGRCRFPEPGTDVDLAVSGGADSVGLTLLAVAGGLRPTIHHVDHHLRERSGADAALVAAMAETLGVPYVRHDVVVAPGPNLEARARRARRAVVPASAMTGHTMDDLAETVLLNLLRGAGVDGLSPMVGDPTKPLLDLRRAELREAVVASGQSFAHDETNDDVALRRNRLRHESLPVLNALAARDLVPVLARQATLLAEERRWLDDVCAGDQAIALATADCRELAQWPQPRLRRWLRDQLRDPDDPETHPPSAEEVARAARVVVGDVVAVELAGGRRLSRSGQRLSLVKSHPVRSAR
jgi:tRNA(Ile)-lysidine synthase